MELYILVVLFGFICANPDLHRIDSIRQEQPCMSAGGICTVAEDCPGHQLSETPGLCPLQRKEGIECCYGISVKETRCQKRGGTCYSLKDSYCNENLISYGATDCGQGNKCCILV